MSKWLLTTTASAHRSTASGEPTKFKAISVDVSALYSFRRAITLPVGQVERGARNQAVATDGRRAAIVRIFNELEAASEFGHGGLPRDGYTRLVSFARDELENIGHFARFTSMMSFATDIHTTLPSWLPGSMTSAVATKDS